MKNLFTILILILFSTISYAQKGSLSSSISPIMTSESKIGIKYEPTVTIKKLSTQSSSNITSNNGNGLNYVSKKSIDLNSQNINPDFVATDDAIYHEIEALKVAIKKNKSDKDYIQELQKQLIVLKERRKYLSDNHLN